MVNPALIIWPYDQGKRSSDVYRGGKVQEGYVKSEPLAAVLNAAQFRPIDSSGPRDQVDNLSYSM